MVNKAEQPEPTQDTGNTTTDITEEFEGVDTVAEEAVSTPEATERTDEAPVTPPAAESAPVAETSTTPPPEAKPFDDGAAVLESRMREIEEQNIKFRAESEQAKLTQAKENMALELENNGYDAQTAKQLFENWAVQESQVAKIQQESLQRERFVQGQANAAEHFANKYNLQLADLAELRRYPDPQTMEAAAKRLQGDRSKDARIAELEAQLVPKQNFDDSQSTPAASNDEDRWLEKYNQGDRSPQASAAARRAAGLG